MAENEQHDDAAECTPPRSPTSQLSEHKQLISASDETQCPHKPNNDVQSEHRFVGDPAKPVQLTKGEWVLVFTMFVLIVQTIVYYKTWKSVEQTVVATKEATELTRQSFERAHRPWLSLDTDLSAQPIKNGQRSMNVVFSVKNAGASPAIGTVIASEFEYLDKPPGRVDQPCRRQTLESIFQGKFGDLVIPQTTRTIPRTIAIPTEDTTKELYLVGCIGYSDERFVLARPTCIPYATSFVWRYSTKPDDCKGDASCFIYGGFGLPLNMQEPKECDSSSRRNPN